MRKAGLQISFVVFFLVNIASAQENYSLNLKGVDRDSAWLVNEAGLKTAFSSRFDCVAYMNKLPSLLHTQGYVNASIDTIIYDSTFARATIYIGEKFSWSEVNTGSVDPQLLDAVGWRVNSFSNKPLDINELSAWQEKILSHLENNGYPFARVYMDSMILADQVVKGKLMVDKGPLYKVDSIRVYGDAKVSNLYLQRYLDIQNGSIYNKEKLQRVSLRLKELPYVEEEKPSNLTRLGTGSVLNLYLKQKKSSQINILLGFLPNNDQLSSKKLLVTGEANILLRNALGSGETIGLNWQQLQVRSPRLHFIFQYPYLFRSPFGLDFAFDMFRKDSTFLNVNFQLGVQYNVTASQSGKIFLQRFQTIVSGVNKNFLLLNRRLPDEADVSSVNLGVEYEFNNTNYRLNPRSGYELRLTGTAGSKKIKRNNEILELKDPGDPTFNFGSLYDTVKLSTYQFRIRAVAAKYFPLGRQSAIKTAFNAGIFQSANIFRNELFQIGGYRLLRGFDEESQYLSQFLIGTFEYRYLVGQNSFFYVLMDGGWGRNNSQNTDASYSYLGAGLGLAFETRAGIFNLALAAGKRNDTEFNLRQSKIHFGFVNYF